VLKVLTLLLDRRLRDWAEANDVLPASQNGFRAHYRTNNNALILRVAIKKARATRKTLYVLSLDVSNAFPSVDRPSLWLRLLHLGVSGPMFDWLRLLYAHMSYVVKSGGEYSEYFESDMGVLIGDSASPFCFIVYVADFAPPVDPDDIELGGHEVADLWQADDIVVIAKSLRALQQKADHADAYCAEKFFKLNAAKSVAIV
jgi:hypothetical protein